MIEIRNNRLLIIDDNADIHNDFRKILSHSASSSALDALEAQMWGATSSQGEEATFELAHAYQGEEGFEMLRAAKAAGRPFSAAFVDMRMPPGWDGLRTVQEIRKIDQDATIVICTAYSDHTWEEIAKRIDGLDKLLVLKKPFDAVEVKSMVQSLTERWSLLVQSRLRSEQLEELVAVRTSELEAERAKDKLRMDQLEEAVAQRTSELRKTALHDRLTGLPNRAQFYDRLLAAISARYHNEAYRYAVMFIDFDRFKVINDSLGHEYGDMLLTSISERLSLVIEPIREATPTCSTRAIAARLGGDEFCILIENYPDESHVHSVAEQTLNVLARPYDLGGRQVNSSASIGITLSRFGYRHAEEVLRDADTAMYCAKAAGKGRAVLFDPSMHERAMRRLVLENDLRHAIDRGELCLQFQPICSLETREIIGAEALLRWKHPQHGLISPSDFIPLAEETGLIVPIGNWVFEQACRWVQRVPELSYLSVNVSRRQLSDGEFPRAFDEVLARTQIDPRRIILEITESTLINEPETAARAIDEARKRKMRVFLDDFGTGLSSLGSLRRFPLDGLKLDRSFLDSEVFSRRAAAVIHSTITLARDLEMSLIAEGVESFDQVSLLQALGCQMAQGFLLSQPLDPEDLLRFVREARLMLPQAA